MTLIEERIKARLAQRTSKGVAHIQDEMKLIEDIGLDSLDIVELLFELEEEFDLEIPNVDAMHFVIVQDVVTYIQERTKTTEETSTII